MVKAVLGCGDLRYGDAVNVDIRPEVADVVADVHALPFPDDSMDSLIAEDLLEHFPADHTAGLLAEWARVLRPGGQLTLKVPNMFALASNLIHRPVRSHRVLIRNVYGGHRWGPDGAYDAHHTGWTPPLLEEDLWQAGFRVTHNDQGLNMRVEAELR